LNYYKVASPDKITIPNLRLPASASSVATFVSVAVQTSPPRDSESAKIVVLSAKRTSTPDASYSSPSKKPTRSRSSSESGCSVVSEYSIKASTVEVEMSKMFSRVSTLPPLIPSFSSITVTRNLDLDTGASGYSSKSKSPDGLEKLKSYVDSVNAELMRQQQQQERLQDSLAEGPCFTVQDEVMVASNDDGNDDQVPVAEDYSAEEAAASAELVKKKSFPKKVCLRLPKKLDGRAYIILIYFIFRTRSSNKDYSPLHFLVIFF